jgi:hypothetical protein
VGFVVGLTGVGGGSLMTPLLVLLFGFRTATAVGNDVLCASVTKTCGTAVHHIGQTVEWRLVGWLGAVPKRPSAFAPEVRGLGTIGLTPAASQATTSSPEK